VTGLRPETLPALPLTVTVAMSILQLFRHQNPSRGPGLVVGSRFRELADKPGYLSLKDGSQELRNLYVDGEFVLLALLFEVYFYHFVGSVAQEPSLLSDFGLACFLGLYEEVKKACLHIYFLVRMWIYLLINIIIHRWSSLELLLAFVVMKHHTVKAI
jgi:hypothetical protein